MLISHPEKALFPEVLLMGASSSLQMKEVPISWSAIVIVPVPLSGPCGCQFPFPPLPHLSHNIDSAPGSDILFYHQQQESMTLKEVVIPLITLLLLGSPGSHPCPIDNCTV